jgi:sulfoxide reductase heme-binding subunit YedZ
MKPRYVKPVIFLACLLPLARLGWKGLNAGLGANPIQVITFSTGTWTLIFLLVTLSITPVRKLTRQYWLIQYRRMLGLFAFFYGLLHFATYFWLDKFFDFPEILKDVAKRPFITAGFLAFICLVPLALTSTAGWIRRLGGRRWQMLHRLIYLTAIAAVAHYYWLVKSDHRLPVFYGSLVVILLGYRVVSRWIPKTAPARARSSAAYGNAISKAAERELS